MEGRIGLRSTGLFVFSARVASAFTGLVFTVMVARWLVPAQFGLWEFIIDLVTFASYPVGLVAFWATRDVARGKLVGRTALALGAFMSGGGVVLYFVFTYLALNFSPSISGAAKSVLPFVLGGLLVPLSYWSQVANSVVQGYRPSALGPSIMASEFTKLLVAYPSLYLYKAGIEGVMVSLIASYLAQSLVSSYLVRGALAGRLELSEGRRWLGAAWLPAISYLPGIVGVSDTAVASLGFGTSIVGNYQAAFSVASVVGYSAALAYSLYPLLLRGSGERLPALTIEFSMLFSLPMAVGASVLADPVLYLLGSKYLVGDVGLVILSFMFVLLTVSGILDQTLLGTEAVDADGDTSFRKLARSNLLFVALVNLSSSVIYVLGVYVALRYSFTNNLSSTESVALWASVQLATTTSFLLLKTARARRSASLLPSSNVLFYAFSSALMGSVVFYLSGFLLDRSLHAPIYGLRLLALIGVGLVVYFGLVYSLDAKFRSMARSVLGSV